MHLECFRPRNRQPQEGVTLRLGSVYVRPQRALSTWTWPWNTLPKGKKAEWFPEGRCQERSTQKACTVRNSNCWYRVRGVGGPSSWSVKPTWKISRRGGTVELIRKTHMESFSSKFVFTGKGANSPSRGHLQRESPDTLEKPQSAVEPYEPFGTSLPV